MTMQLGVPLPLGTAGGTPSERGSGNPAASWFGECRLLPPGSPLIHPGQEEANA